MKDYKETVRRVFDEVYGAGRVEVLDEVCATGYVNHDPFAGDLSVASEKEFVRNLRKAFPDFKLQLLTAIAEGEYVCARWHASGTQAADFFDVPNAGKHFEIDGIDMVRLDRNGRVIEAWTHPDVLGLLQQLGAIPSLERKARYGERPEAQP